MTLRMRPLVLTLDTAFLRSGDGSIIASLPEPWQKSAGLEPHVQIEWVRTRGIIEVSVQLRVAAPDPTIEVRWGDGPSQHAKMAYWRRGGNEMPIFGMLFRPGRRRVIPLTLVLTPAPSL